MRIVTQINDEDYIAFNNAYQFKSEEGRKRFTLYMVLFSIMLGMSVLIILTDLLNGMLNGKLHLSDYIVPIFITVYCIYFLVAIKSRVRKKIRKRVEKYRQEGTLLYDPEATIDFTDEMIMEYTPKSTTRREWSEIKSIIADDEHYFLMHGPMQGMIIPIRCLGTEASTFLPYVQQRTGLGVVK